MLSRLSISIALSIIAALSFGSLLHAIVPHTHAYGDAGVDLMHAALRHEDRSLFADVVPVALFGFSVLAAIALSDRRIISSLDCSEREPAPELAFIRQGRADHRKFR